jgi:hypothetical protein
VTVFGYIEGSFLVNRTGDVCENHVYLIRICVITILLQSGGGTWGTVLYTVKGVGSGSHGMSTIGVKTSLYTEDQGTQVPITLDHGNIVGTQCCDTLSHTS